MRAATQERGRAVGPSLGTRSGGRLGRARARTGALLTLPALLVLFAVVGFPAICVLNLSFRAPDPGDLSLFGGAWAGLRGYADVLTDSAFLSALWQTVGFVSTTVAVEILIGLTLALQLNKRFRGNRAARLVLTTPLLIAPVVAALSWKFLLIDGYGPVNFVLERLGLDGPQWLAGVWPARVAVLLANLWVATPFVLLVLLAGLAGIPDEVNEAAQIDGAHGLRLLWHITLPLLRPAFMVILVIRMIDAFRMFDIIYVMTNGGPGTSTQVVSTYIYERTFTDLDFSGGAAAAVLMVCVTLLLSVGIVRLVRPKEG